MPFLFSLFYHNLPLQLYQVSQRDEPPDAPGEQTIANKEKRMLTIIIVLALFIVLDIAALRWGVDSTESVVSGEWERRWHWSEDVDDQLVAYNLFL